MPTVMQNGLTDKDNRIKSTGSGRFADNEVEVGSIPAIRTMDDWPRGIGASLQNWLQRFDSAIVLHASLVQRTAYDASNVKIWVRVLDEVPCSR